MYGFDDGKFVLTDNNNNIVISTYDTNYFKHPNQLSGYKAYSSDSLERLKEAKESTFEKRILSSFNTIEEFEKACIDEFKSKMPELFL